MKTILLFIMTIMSLGSMAQKSMTELKGNKHFNNYAYQEAINKYVQVDDLTVNGQRSLALSYMYNGESLLAEQAFKKLGLTDSSSVEDMFHYALVLRSNEKYDKSDLWMRKLNTKNPNDQRGRNYVVNASKLDRLRKDEGRFEVVTLTINTDQQDFAPAYYNDQLVFSSTREGVKSIKRNYNWNGKPFLDLYVATVDGQQLVNPKELNKKINNKMHEGVASFTSNGDLMAFTRNNYQETSTDGTVKLELFFVEKDSNGKWLNEVPFKYNNKEYSVGHPCLSADGNVMYFTSDMPGGMGGADIYRVERNEDKTWGEVHSLGADINSEGNEMFPFYEPKSGVLYFASNGHLGLGGLDIFASKKESNGSFNKVKNVGVPLNSKADDFGIILNLDSSNGYFSSNREGGMGDDDIYRVNVLKGIAFGKKIIGTATSKEGVVLDSTMVFLKDAELQIVDSVITGNDGSYSFHVNEEKSFVLTGHKRTYFEGENTADTKTDDDVIVSDLILEKDPGLSLVLLVTNKSTGKIIPGVTVVMIDKFTNSYKEYATNNSGYIREPLANKKIGERGSFQFIIQKEGFFTKVHTYNVVFDHPGQYNVHEVLDFTLDVEVEDLSKLVEINPINFDLNKFNIRPDAAIELDKIVGIMNAYPNMVVELGAHTDCRGSKAYNERLSNKRAVASAKYIKKRIENPDRINGKGYGESKLLNDCACEGNVKSSCEEEVHALNRRTEFKVLNTGNADLQLYQAHP